MKRFLILIFVIAMTASLVLTGCNPAETTGTSAGTTAATTAATTEGSTTAGTTAATTAGPESNMNPAGIFPIVKEPVTLSVFVAPEPWLGEFKDNWVTQEYEKITNVKIEWMQVGRDDVANRINLLLASGTGLPDVFMTGINREQQVVYGGQGVFLPLNDYIDEYGVGVSMLFGLDPTVRGQITAPDGNIYGLPEYNECYHCDFSMRMWINETWLENLGLAKPNTIDEYYEVLKAFKANDANKNGDPNDEIPLAAANDNWHGGVEGFLMNAFVKHQGTGSDRMYFDDNKKIQFAPISDQWREGLRYMRKLYEEGLMDQEIFIMDSAQVRQLTENPAGNRIGSIPAGHYGIFADLAIDGAKLDFGPLAPLEGPDGLRYATRFLTGINMCFFITNVCEEPEVAYRWGDGQYGDPSDPENDRVWMSWGEKGVDWRAAEPGEKGLDGREAVYAPILPYGEAHNRHWGQPHPQIVTNVMRFSSVAPQDAWDHEQKLYVARHDFYEQYGPEMDMVIPPLFMDPTAVEEVGELRTVVRDYISETVAGFVTGTLDIEADWDSVVANFKAMEVERFVQMIQDNYDRQYGN